MADITSIFGGGFVPPSEKVVAPVEEQLRNAMRDVGIEPPDYILIDGNLHRFKSGTKGKAGHDKAGWYVVFGDGVPAGSFGCWRAGIEVNFKADMGRSYTVAEQMAITKRISEAKAARDEEAKRKQDIASDTVDRIWSDCGAASSEHPYLLKKGIRPHGARVTGDGRLVVPLYDNDGVLCSLQYIDDSGGKLYHPGGKTGACFWVVGTFDEPGLIFIAEGFATAATIHEASGRPVIVAYSASNLVPVAGLMRENRGKEQEIVIVADNDESGVGQRYAEQACAKHGCRMVMPPVLGDANDFAKSGGDLAGLLFPPVEQWLIPADDFSAQPAPISWLVKNWIQENALVMVHGPSGGGKTFVVLDWCLRMASNTAAWGDCKVKAGTVVYLAGEGHNGLRGRIAAWKNHNQCANLSMWLSKDGCDLNTAQGYLHVVSQIRLIKQPPKVIVVDTLHRFLLGDENSAQDAKTMLDACNSLMNEFQCTVILVHHTGVSDEAQHRARGSSAWRGALDIEISIVPQKEDAPMEIIQRKSKDAELAKTVYAELNKVDINGWVDEDGNPVTSAIVNLVEGEIKDKKNPKLEKHKKMFENAWWSKGKEIRNEMPYLSRSAFIDFMVNDAGIAEKSASVYVKPSADGKPVCDLLNHHIIAPLEHGWVVVDEVMSSAMMMG
jgi:phage/plasmid primase-like uncharacterized protein